VLWCDTARGNSEAYAQVFPYSPFHTGRAGDRKVMMEGSCTIRSKKEQIDKEQQYSKSGVLCVNSLSAEDVTALNRIKGYVIEYPLWYLDDDSLLPPQTSKEYVIPPHVFM